VDAARVQEIYEIVSSVHVQLQEDPRVMGPGYISRTIQRTRDAEEKVNGFYTEVQQSLSAYRQELSLRELDRKVRLRQKLMSNEIRTLEVSANERAAHAEASLENEYRAEAKLALEQEGKPIPAHVHSLEEEIVLLQNNIEALRTLLDVINEKKASLNKTDSAVRLQEKAMDTEARVFGGPPAHNVARTAARGRPNGPVRDNPTWGALAGDPAGDTPPNQIGKEGTAEQG